MGQNHRVEIDFGQRLLYMNPSQHNNAHVAKSTWHIGPQSLKPKPKVVNDDDSSEDEKPPAKKAAAAADSSEDEAPLSNRKK